MPGVTVLWCHCAVSWSLFAVVCSSTVDETKNVDNMIEGTRKASHMFALNFLTLFQFYQCLCGIYTDSCQSLQVLTLLSNSQGPL